MKYVITVVFFLVVSFVFPQDMKLSKSCITNGEYIFETAPFTQCHASTLVELADHRIMAAWFGGTHEKHPDVCIWGSVRDQSGWSEIKLLADGVINDTLRYPCWNPVLFRDKNNTLHLFYKVGPSPREWWGMVKVSTNDGRTWSKAERLENDILGPIKNKPVQLESGRIISPSSTESNTGWQAHVEISDDHGKSWKKIPIDPESSYKVIQPTILIHKNGELQAMMRSDQNCIVESWSNDEGKTWGRLQKSNLPNPNSGIDAVTLKNGINALVYNPTISGKDWWNGRHILALATSPDGINWTETGELEKLTEGELSYPAIIQSEDGSIHITYTHNRTRIKYVKLILK